MASLRFPGVVRHLDLDVVDGEGFVGNFASESAGGVDHNCRHLWREARVGLGRHAGDPPLQKIPVAGPSGPCVDRNLAGEVLARSALSGGWNGGRSGRGHNEG